VLMYSCVGFKVYMFVIPLCQFIIQISCRTHSDVLFTITGKFN